MFDIDLYKNVIYLFLEGILSSGKNCSLKTKGVSSLEKWRNKFPDFIFKASLYTEGRIIIVDQEIPQEIEEKLSSLATKNGTETLLLKPQEIAGNLDALLKKELSEIISPKGTLFVFPGRGGTEVKALSELHRVYPQTEVFAKRFWKPGSKPAVAVGTITPPAGIRRRKIKRIVVPDDVISSGETLHKLYEKNFSRFKTGCVWIGGSWFAQVPRMKQTSSGVKGYQKIITAVIVKGPQGKKVPLNSLSTLILDPQVSQSYTKRHFHNPRDFLNLLKKTKQKNRSSAFLFWLEKFSNKIYNAT